MRYLTFFLVWGWLAIHPGTAFGGELFGKVTDRDGKPAANIQIAVEGRTATAKTSNSGEYTIDLPRGAYTLIIQGQQFAVTVLTGRTEQNIRLQ